MSRRFDFRPPETVEIPVNVVKGTEQAPRTIVELLQEERTQLMVIADAIRQSPLELAKLLKDQHVKPEIERRRSKLFQIDAASNGIDNVQWGFLARTYLIQNVTNQWWYLPNESLWIAPWLVNMNWPLSVGTQMLRVVNQAPLGLTQGTPTTGQQLIVQGESILIGASAGVGV